MRQFLSERIAAEVDPGGGRSLLLDGCWPAACRRLCVRWIRRSLWRRLPRVR
jgi:hypothetical protein